MTTDTSVKYFDSTMSGAPSLNNTVGALITVLDAVLVNGFGSVTLDSLVVASNVATGSISTGHGFAMVGGTGPVITIAGATPAGLNGEFRIQSVSDANTFTFTTSGVSDQTATGTITAKRAPAGFEKAFTGTNLAAYRSLDVTGTQLYLRVDDTYGNYVRVRGYEDFADQTAFETDAGTKGFPLDSQFSGGGYCYKASGTNRAWTLFSDEKLFYFFCDASNNATWGGGLAFGDLDSYVGSDAYHCFVQYSNSSSGNFFLYLLSANVTYGVLARNYTQLGDPVVIGKYSHGIADQIGGSQQPYPAPADNAMHVWPVEAWDGSSNARGMMPGLWNPIHADADINQGVLITDIPQLPNRTLITQKTASNYRCVLDATGPWRTT